MSIDPFRAGLLGDEQGALGHAGPLGGWQSEEADQLVPTHCCFCGMQCGMYIKLNKQGAVIGVEPRDFPMNQGRLCPKGVVAYQQARHPHRLVRPLLRRGGKGSPLEPASWDEALSFIVDRIQAIQAAHGKDTVAVYSGSSMTTEKAYLMGKFARVALGTRQIDYNGRLCMVSAAAANVAAFGLDRAANPWSDIPLAEVLLLAGTNTAECHPITMQYLWQARDRGARMIVVDPRITPLARTADIHLPIRPGTDSALANAMLHVLIAEGLLDQHFIAERTAGFEAVKAHVAAYTPERVARVCGVPAGRIVEAARLWGHAKTSFLGHARGIEHHTKGTKNVLSYINLVLASGRIGRPGCGYATLTGQGNGQGGREHGQKADQLPGQRKIDDPAARQHIAQVWGIAEHELPQAGLAITEQIPLMQRGEIKALLQICSNPMVSLPDLGSVEAALRALELYVVVDFFPSESAALADVVLPGSVWLEDEGSTTNVEGRVLRINRAADPPGEARVDWQIICDLAARLGKGDHFPYRSSGEIWEELRRASKGGKADYAGISYEKIEAQDGVFWPCPEPEHPGTPRLFEQRFSHPDGRARFTVVDYTPPAEQPDDDYPFFYTTGRSVHHYLSGNQTRRLPSLVENAPEAYVELHPQAAQRLGIQPGDLVRVHSRRGAAVVPARVTRTIRPDTVFMPYHWGGRQAANNITANAVDPYSKIPEYKVCAVALERVDGPEEAA